MKKVFDKSTFPTHQPFKSSPLISGDNENVPSSQPNSQPASQQNFKAPPPPQPEPTSNVFNGHLKRRQPSPKTSSFPFLPLTTTLDILPDHPLQPRRHMYNKPSERAAAINERIERMARKWTESGIPCKFEDLAHPARAHPEPVITVGRIVCENESPLNEGALFLESSRNIGSGVRVRLDCSAVNNLALFPGQIVMVEGINSDGRIFHVHRFLQPSNPLMKFDKPLPTYADYSKFSDGNMAIIVASGPYTLDHALDYSPLSALLQKVSELMPEVLILCGPFVDVEHSLFKSGEVGDFPEDIFKLHVMLRLTEFSEDNPQTRIILVPSLRDAVASEFVYPQCPFKVESHQKIFCVSNPCSFFVNEILFTIENNDVMKRLAEEFVLRPGNDRLGRISSCLLEQASLYPVMPAAYGANLDYTRLEGVEIQLNPDILLCPSDLGSFARSLDSGSSVCINPGRSCRKIGLGSLALLTISAPQFAPNKADVISSRLRVDFLNL